jgi:hypothetical protein
VVPEEIVNIYFITEPSSPWVDQKPSIRVIKFNGGMGKPGTPWLPWLLINLVALAVAGVMFLGLSSWLRRGYAAYYGYLGEAIQRGLSASSTLLDPI